MTPPSASPVTGPGLHFGAAPRRRAFRDLLLAALIAAAALGLGVTYMVNIAHGRPPGPFGDFAWYVEGGRNTHLGLSPYSGFTAAVARNFGGVDYPPLIEWLMQPLAILPLRIAQILWLAIIMGTTALGFIIMATTMLPATWPRIRLALLATVLYAPATANYWAGQANPLVLVVLALALRAYVNNRPGRTALWIAAAAAIKLAPLVLVVLLIRRGWWRSALVAVGGFAASLILGGLLTSFAALHYWIFVVLPTQTGATGWGPAQSWNTLISRLFSVNTFVLQSNRPVQWAAATLSVIGICAAAGLVRRGAATHERRAAEFSIGLVSMLLATSLAWTPEYIYALPLIAAAALRVCSVRPWDRELLAAVVLALVGCEIVVAAISLEVGTLYSLRTSLWLWPVLQLVSLPTISIAVVAIVLGVRMWRDKDVDAAMAHTEVG